MRPATEILAEQLRLTLTEACCGGCGSMSKKLDKKVCCSGHKTESKVIGEPRYVTVDELKRLSQTPEAEAALREARARSAQTEAKEKHTAPFIKRCVASMTSGGEKDPHNPASLSSAFAICTAAKKRHPAAAKEKAKEGVPENRMAQYEKALSVARKARQAK